MIKSVRIKISGRVQHVGYRYFATKEAGKYLISLSWMVTSRQGLDIIDYFS